MLGWLERHQFLVLACACLLLAGGLLARASRGEPDGVLVFEDEPEAEADAPISVHVAGAVTYPGVYELRAGDRVSKAVDAAGGAVAGARLDGLNLARPLRDGERIMVPGAVRAVQARSFALAAGEKVDLNLAGMDELHALPGIGDAYARRIVDSRKVDGPFKSADELVARRVVPPATFERIRDLVFVMPQ
jgi:competence protein ComEA